MKNLQPVFIREDVIKAARDFFYKRNFHEVITPTLTTTVPLEPNIYPFKTEWQSAKKKALYLATSPERGLKKMLAYGVGNCFAISKAFRNLEDDGSLHIPEFLMLEWYRENSDYFKIMDDVKTLILFFYKKVYQSQKNKLLTYQGNTIDLSRKWSVLSLVDLFRRYANLDLEEILDEQAMIKAAEKKGYAVKDASWNQLYDQIFVNEIESHIPQEPVFLIDFPTKISPLCKVKKNQSHLAERFEFYLFGIELGNGNNESTDYKKVESRFQKEKRAREKLGLPAPEIDLDFILSLKTMARKNYAGIGMGIDRLAMILANTPNITEIELLYS